MGDVRPQHPGVDDDTAPLDDWPVDPAYAPQPLEPAVVAKDERGTVALGTSSRSPLTVAAALGALGLIVVLGLALLWALTRDSQPPQAATETTGGAIASGQQAGSSAPARVTLPRLVGLPAATVGKALRSMHLKVETSSRQSDASAGSVIEQHPASGTLLAHGAVVRIVVAAHATAPRHHPTATKTTKTTTSAATSGTASATTSTTPAEPAKVLMPRLVGSSLADAQQELRSQGLRAAVERVTSSEDSGTVLAQTPVAGAQLRRGMSVTLRVASAPPRVEIPNVTGLGEAAARSRLTAAGLEVTTVDEDVTDSSQDGAVIGVDPPVGTRATRGATVTITVGRVSTTTTTTPTTTGSF
jgi:beta-lactam-binding protein with PASTA domain